MHTYTRGPHGDTLHGCILLVSFFSILTMIEVGTLEAYVEIFWGLFLFTDVGNIDVNLMVYFRLFLIIVVVGNLDTNIGCCYCILFFYSGIGDLFSIMDMMMGNLDANIGAYLRQRWVVFQKQSISYPYYYY